MWSNRNDIYFAVVVWLIHQHGHDAQSELTVGAQNVANTLYNELRSNSTSNFRRPSPFQLSTDNTIQDSTRSSDSYPLTSSTQSPSYKGYSRMSIANMTCEFFEQPLNHFVPRGKSPNYQQRYCYYDEYATTVDHVNETTKKGKGSDEADECAPQITSPIFFYTGNESPLEQYINQVCSSWYRIKCVIYQFLVSPC
jgi:hypothetical protein